jgi:BirA family transcriptional regulator, biotin operon repressor / biotin---[acetyl-CoA-carboxylase] ligase
MPAFDLDRFRSLARDRRIALGAPIVVMDATGSTNDDAMAAARGGAVHGLTIVAERQTAGRGRRGSRWSSPPGDNLTFSVLLRSELPLARVAALPLAVGLAVRDVVQRRVSTHVTVKWPNDVLADDSKLAGILVESQLQAGRVEALVVGIGLNVAMRELPEEIRELATSLALLGASELGRERLLVELLEALEARVTAYAGGGVAAILPDLRAHDALRGRPVQVDELSGIARGIAEDGALLVEDAGGSLHRILGGGVTLARPR